MGLFSRKRYAVATLMVAVDGRLKALLPALADATERIIESEDMDVASEQVARIAGALLEYESRLTAVASWGQVFTREEDAGLYGDEVFAECAGRYLSSGLEADDEDDSLARAALPPPSHEGGSDRTGSDRPGSDRTGSGQASSRALASLDLEGTHIVVMLTVGYEGTVPELEKTVSTRDDVAAALSAIRALHHKQALALAHIHYAPGHSNEVLTDDQLLVNYPELVTL